jgi:hypothetical protein
VKVENPTARWQDIAAMVDKLKWRDLLEVRIVL